MNSILLVDDSRSIRAMYSQSLRSEGFEVVEADNGEAGVGAAKDRQLDLVLTDLNMPRMNGLELTKRLRSLPRHSATPILVVTTESQLTRKQEAKQAGATGWIVKPVPPGRLVQIVSHVLSKD